MPAPSASKSARHFTVTLNQGLSEALYNYCQVEGCSAGEATRMILQQFFASEPESGAIQAARARGYNEVRTWMLTQANRWFKEMHTLLNTELASTPGPHKNEGASK